MPPCPCAAPPGSPPVVKKLEGGRCRHPCHHRQGFTKGGGIRCDALIRIVQRLLSLFWLLLLTLCLLLLLLLLLLPHQTRLPQFGQPLLWLLQGVEGVLVLAVAAVQVSGEVLPPAQRQRLCGHRARGQAKQASKQAGRAGVPFDYST